MTTIYDALLQSAPLRPATDHVTGLETDRPSPAEPDALRPGAPPLFPRPVSPPAAGPDPVTFPVRVLRTARRPPWQSGQLP